MVEVESRLMVAQRVTGAPDDKEELVPTVEAIAQAAGSLESKAEAGGT